VQAYRFHWTELFMYILTKYVLKFIFRVSQGNAKQFLFYFFTNRKRGWGVGVSSSAHCHPHPHLNAKQLLSELALLVDRQKKNDII
jgi:hypothetical protein